MQAPLVVGLRHGWSGNVHMPAIFRYGHEVGKVARSGRRKPYSSHQANICGVLATPFGVVWPYQLLDV